MGRTGPLKRSFDNDDGIEFVCCRICGDHRRVISGRHPSKHDTDRETYIEEYHLTPDELIAKDFRRIQSSRHNYYPNGKNEWIAAMKNVYKKDGKVFAGYLQANYAHLYEQGIWIFGDWDKALNAAGFKKCESVAYGTKRKSLRQYAPCTKNICRSTSHT